MVRFLFGRLVELERGCQSNERVPSTVCRQMKMSLRVPSRDGKVCDFAPTPLKVPPATVEAVQIGCSWMEVLRRRCS